MTDATADEHTDSSLTTEDHAETHTPEPHPASVAECELNLLEHIESVHGQISAGMDLIERELDGKPPHPNRLSCFVVWL